MINVKISDKVKARGKRYADKVKAAKAAILAGEPGADRVTISAGNDKMGAVKSVSLMPLTTCPFRAWGTCGNYCYACAMADNGARKNVAASYARNTAVWLADPGKYWAAVRAAVAGSRFFRFHVAGDIPTADYCAEMFRTAADFPKCDILVFTKQFEIVNAEIAARGGSIPANLHIMFSGGPEIDMKNPYNIPVALFIPYGETAPENAKVCGGNCLECGCRGVGCWQLAAGDILALHEHGNGHNTRTHHATKRR